MTTTSTDRRFSANTDISATPERVWQVMSDVESWNEWTPSVRSIKRIGSAPFGVGSRLVINQPKLPPAFWKVTEMKPGKSITWVSVAPGMKVVARHRVDKIVGGSTVTLSLKYEGILGGFFARMTKKITDRYLAFETAGLKARSENPKFVYARE